MKKISFCFIAILLMITTIMSISANSNIALANSINGLSAKSYIVVDANGKVLLENNADEKREVASICKLMTTLLTLEEIDNNNLSLEDKVTASAYACDAEGSQAFLDAGKDYSVKDLLKSVIVASANDSAIVLAETLGGTEQEFVKLMNNRAKELGMSNTLYANSTGLPADQQYSTARDTAIILNEVSQYQIYQDDCQIWMDKLIHHNGRETELVNTNRLIKYYPYCVTGKTGFTDEAGYCLSTTALKNNLKLTCVVLGCDTASERFTDSVSLYNNAYSNYVSEKVLDKTICIENNIQVKRGKSDAIEIIASEDYYLTLSKNNKESYEIKYTFDKELSAPINVGDHVGTAQIIVENSVIGEVDLVSNTQIEKQGYKDVIYKIIDSFSIIK